MNIKNILTIWYSLILGLTVLIPVPAQATILSLSSTPLFLGSVKPNVMVMLDNSGSMKDKMYKTSFNPANDYYGLFNSNMNYEYDSTIPVNAAGYAPMLTSSIDTTKKGAFKESNCNPASVGNTNCWDGNFLNWITTRRIDASRKVLMGGKLEDTAAFNYGVDLNYKIIGNNEPLDSYVDNRFNNLKYSNSRQYSPVPNGATMVMKSPAASGAVKSQYDPYAKLTVGGDSGLIYDQFGNQIGEFGTTITTHVWTTVTLSGTYASAPAVISKAPTKNGADPGVTSIRNVTPTSFQIKFNEWEYKDGGHIKETFTYVVLKKGNHLLPGGVKIDADTITTDKEWVTRSCGSSTSSSKNVNFNTTFNNTPIVITSLNTVANSVYPANSRVYDVHTGYFKVFLQQEEDNAPGGHPIQSETISYIAIEKGTVTDAVNSPPWQLEVDDFAVQVDENVRATTFSSTFQTNPAFVADMQSKHDAETATLRRTYLNNTQAKVYLQEEKSCNSETNHANEDVGYFAFSGLGAEMNVALVVENKPTGLLHDIKDKVRMGVSFYRFNPNDGNIYSENVDGGTLQFKIPKNPFVKKPTDTAIPSAERGYRTLTGYIGMSVEDAADALENYPLVWGTTPLAENLWEVIRYFEQEPPRYANVGGTADFIPNKGTVNDPFYYASQGVKLECAKSSVIIFTDGEPYKDAAVDSAHGFSPQDYDGDTNPTDLVANSDLLDDVAYYGFCATQGSGSGSCADAVTGDGDRDLRSDLAGNQFLKVYTVAFGASSIPSVLQDTADNAGGTAYLAEDGASLKTALTQAFTAAIDDSSASAVSVNTGSITSDTTVFQAQFNSNDWTGKLLAYPVNSDGTLGTAQLASYLPALASSRVIVTHNGTQGIPFQWPAVPGSPTATELTIAQQGVLNNDSNLLNFLRGDDSNEIANGGSFRDRTKIDHDGDNIKDRIAIGDMIHSSPAYVGLHADYSYPDYWGSGAAENTVTYSSFKTAIIAYNNTSDCNSNQGRLPMVYVGANDGMLHAFNANAYDCDNNGTPDDANFGKELFAFLPNAVMSKAATLANSNYAHQYMVDASPSIVDAFYDGGWHTVLASGLRGGGQGVFALDITNPVGDWNTEANAASKVLWEFTDANDADLGYTFSRPNIVRMHNGKWAAVFGNGYNNTEADSHTSTTGNAVLYIVNIETGALIKKIDTGVGWTDLASGKTTGTPHGRPNGLSHVAPVDIDGDYIIDYIYGGDLYGNLWKFDVRDSVASNWTIYNGASHDKPLFQTQAEVTTDGYCEDLNGNSIYDPGECEDTYKRQPITVRPEIGYNDEEGGYMVYFGTGQYMETTDSVSTGQQTQSFYGVWDRDNSATKNFLVTSAALLKQEITDEISVGFDTNNDNIDDVTYDLRVTTKHDVVWHGRTDNSAPADGPDADTLIDTHLGWYLDLLNPDGSNYGERQVSDPVLRNGRIIFTTLLPSDDPCASGGSGWLMELDALTGQQLDYSPFDLNGDDSFNAGDFITVTINGNSVQVPVSGKKSKVGIIAAPGIVASADGTKEFKYNSGSSGDIEVSTENPGPNEQGRQSWKHLDF